MFYSQSHEGVRLDCISHCILFVVFLSLGVLFSLHALLILYFHFSHLVSFSLKTVPNFTLNSAACNRLHAFACSVRVGCLISACNVRVILARKLDIFIHFCPILLIAVNIFLLVQLCFLDSILFCPFSPARDDR